MKRREAPKCKCGCGQPVNQGEKGWNIYLKGHYAKDKTRKNHSGWKHSSKVKEYLSSIKKGKPGANKGWKMSEETKEKLRKAHTGKKLSEEHKRKIGAGTYRQTKEYKEKQRIAQTGRVQSKKQKETISAYMKKAWADPSFRDSLIRENAYGWMGGLSFAPYGIQFNSTLKRKIKKRDKNTCQNPNCPKTAKYLSVHHIDYDKQNSADKNLITLCVACNSIANYNREWWKEFYTQLIKNKYEKMYT